MFAIHCRLNNRHAGGVDKQNKETFGCSVANQFSKARQTAEFLYKDESKLVEIMKRTPMKNNRKSTNEWNCIFAINMKLE